MATEYRNNAKLNVVTRRWREHFPTPPSPSLPPLCSPLLRCRSFPALLQLALVSLFCFMRNIPELTSECSPIFNFGESSRFLSKRGSIVASGSPHSGPL